MVQLNKNTLLLAALTSSELLFSAAAWAVSPVSSPPLSQMAKVVPDPALSQMRGRYVSPTGQLVYFGVQIATQWKAGNGETLMAGLNFGVDMNNKAGAKFVPTVTIVPGQGGNANNGGSSTTINGNSIGTVKGIGQSIQVTGDDNRIKNDLKIHIGPPGSTQHTTGGAGVTPGSTQVVGANGSIATVNLGKNGMGVEITVPGQGHVLQQIQAGNGLHQNAQIFGSINQVRSSIIINAEMRDLKGSLPGGIQTALDSIKDLSR